MGLLYMAFLHLIINIWLKGKCQLKVKLSSWLWEVSALMYIEWLMQKWQNYWCYTGIVSHTNPSKTTCWESVGNNIWCSAQNASEKWCEVSCRIQTPHRFSLVHRILLRKLPELHQSTHTSLEERNHRDKPQTHGTLQYYGQSQLAHTRWGRRWFG